MEYVGFWRWLWWRIGWVIYTVFLRTFFRHTASGQETLPADGPYLLLINHASMLDPVWASYHPWRVVHFMGSAALFRVPILKHVVRSYNAFPKEKFVSDRDSMKRVQELYEAGQIVGIAPEGTRTLDGRPQPVGDGIGRLIKRLDARVVFCRHTTGFLVQPRWARFPRWVPLKSTFSPPRTFPPSMTAEEITDVVRQELLVDTEPRFEELTLAFRPADGLPDYLWACPACFALRGLHVDPASGSRVVCRDCGAGWTVRVDNRLQSPDGDLLSIPEAFDRIAEHFGDPPVADAERFEEEEVALAVGGGHIDRLVGRDKPPERVAEGELRVTREGLEVLQADGTAWRLAHRDIESVSLEVLNVLRAHAHGSWHELRCGEDSPLLWAHFLRYWRHRACGLPGKPPPS